MVETLVGARVLARRLGLTLSPHERPTLREVFGRWLGVAETKGGPATLDVAALRAGLERILPEVEKLKPGKADGQEGVTLQEMVEWSGLDEGQFKELYLSWVDGMSCIGCFRRQSSLNALPPFPFPRSCLFLM